MTNIITGQQQQPQTSTTSTAASGVGGLPELFRNLQT